MKEKYTETGRTNQKLETRKKIMASAQHFLEQGVEFGLEDVAKKTGISRATIYRYFSNVDVLATEAGLDISTKSPESIYEDVANLSFEDKILEVQRYYNTLSVNNENTFRRYLTNVIDSNTSEPKRGARRKKTLKLILEDAKFSSREKEDLANLLTILMGMEPLIVTKDVCGLDNEKSLQLMRWGTELILKGFRQGKK